jgi:hypothetical protein
MKAHELKQIIKPLIKECLKEVLIEEGFTKMLSESVRQPTAVEQIKTETTRAKQDIQAQKAALLEAKKKLIDNIGKSGFDAFAGTQPLRESEEVNANPGIDISSLMGNKEVWKQTLDAMNKKK